MIRRHEADRATRVPPTNDRIWLESPRLKVREFSRRCESISLVAGHRDQGPSLGLYSTAASRLSKPPAFSTPFLWTSG